jgi:hypothetical protein
MLSGLPGAEPHSRVIFCGRALDFGEIWHLISACEYRQVRSVHLWTYYCCSTIESLRRSLSRVLCGSLVDKLPLNLFTGRARFGTDLLESILTDSDFDVDKLFNIAVGRINKEFDSLVMRDATFAASLCRMGVSLLHPGRTEDSRTLRGGIFQLALPKEYGCIPLDAFPEQLERAPTPAIVVAALERYAVASGPARWEVLSENVNTACTPQSAAAWLDTIFAFLLQDLSLSK